MKQVKLFCDKCKKETEFLSWVKIRIDSSQHLFCPGSRDFGEICNDCLDKLKEKFKELFNDKV